jgi:hypothetical protein
MSPAEPPPFDHPRLTADALLASPRGRALCLQLLDDRLAAAGPEVEQTWLDALDAAAAGDTEGCARKLGECTRNAGLDGTPFDDSALLAALQDVVGGAVYWAEPDEEDRGFATGAAREGLRPAAEAVAAAAGSPGLRWWSEPADFGCQRYTQFLGTRPEPEPRLAGAAARAGAWRADTVADEPAARPATEHGPTSAPPGGRPGGRWWSSPAASRLPATTRARPALGAVRLVLAEGGPGARAARCWPVTPGGGARVYEIGRPDQWAELAVRYPLDVTHSRGRDWQRATGWAGRCLVPDFAAVAADWDAVHVSVTGYLTTAAIALAADDGAATMLAGWDPDATWWLADVLSPAGAPEDWQADARAPLGWSGTRSRLLRQQGGEELAGVAVLVGRDRLR